LFCDFAVNAKFTMSKESTCPIVNQRMPGAIYDALSRGIA
jgi:hypothetical protein